MKPMEQPSYSIKLDELDVNYFLKDHFQGSKPSPLWDLNGRSAYRQFQVFVGKKPEDCCSTTDNDNSTNYEKYECILCNTKVPTMYRKEHNNSPKHRTSVGIVKVALERVTAMLLSNDDPSITKTANTYYCETCEIVVTNNEKINHESSEAHQKATIHIKILNDLHMIYKNKDYLDVVDFEYLTRSKDVTNGHTERSVSKSEIAENATEDCTSVPPTGVDNEEIKASIKSNTETTETTIIKPIHMLKDVGNDRVQITTVDNCVLEVSIYNYHGLCSKSKRKICKICLKGLDGSRAKHVVTSEHQERINIPLLDRHCFRQIASTCSNYVSYHHCVLCNENFSNFEDHKTTKEHEEALMKALVTEPQIPAVDTKTSSCVTPSPSDFASPSPAAKKPTKIGKTYCKSCDLFIDTHNYKVHLQSKKHAGTLDKKPIKINNDHTTHTKHLTTESKLNAAETQLKSAHTNGSSVHTSANKDHTNDTKIKSNTTEATSNEGSLDYHYQLLDFNNVYCRVCEKRLPNRVRNKIEHLKGGNHLINLNGLLLNNKITKKNNQLYCHHCKVNIEFQKELDHIGSLKHKSTTSEATSISKVESKSAKLETNTTKLNTNTKNLETYTAKHDTSTAPNKYNTAKHDTSIAINGTYIAIHDTSTAPNEYNTAKHETSTATNESNTAIHDTSTATNEYNTAKHDTSTATNESNTAIHDTRTAKLETNSIKCDKTDAKTLSYHLQDLNSNKVYCRVCKTKVNNRVMNIVEHLNGGRHSTTYANLLSENKIKKLQNNQYFCDDCKINIDFQKELDHVACVKHKFNTAVQAKTKECNSAKA